MKTSVAQRVKKYRDSLRSLGLRPIQIWIPDTRKRGFKAECKRQSLALKNDKHEDEILTWLDSVADREGWK